MKTSNLLIAVLLCVLCFDTTLAYCPSKEHYVKQAGLKTEEDLFSLIDTLDNIASVRINIAAVLENEHEARNFCHAVFNERHEEGFEKYLGSHTKEKSVFQEIEKK